MMTQAKSARLLVVDDNTDLLEVESEILRGAGYEVATALSGAEAIAKIRGGRFDLILTDILMADKDGFDVMMEARRIAPGVKIIAVSGGGRVNASSYLAIAKTMGAGGTLLKPFSGEDLVGVVARTLAGGGPEAAKQT